MDVHYICFTRSLCIRADLVAVVRRMQTDQSDILEVRTVLPDGTSPSYHVPFEHTTEYAKKLFFPHLVAD